MNYEQEISTTIENELKRLYTEDKQNLYPYLMSRYLLENNRGKDAFGSLFKKHFMDYILNHLGISSPTFRKEQIFFGYHEENSLSSILDSWMESTGMDERTLYKEVLQETGKARRKAYIRHLKFRNDRNYKEIVRLAALKELEAVYEIEDSGTPGRLDGFEYPIHFKNSHTKGLDEYTELIKNSPFHEDEYSEKDVRDYLYHHMNELEEGIQIRRRNAPVKSVTLDFIARDRNGVLTIINIMANQSKSTIVNIDFYRDEIRKLYDEENVRVILLFAYRDLFIENNLDNVEIIHYIPKMRFGEIRSIQFNKIKKENKKC